MSIEARNSAKRIELLERRLAVGAIDQGLMRFFKRLRRRDIGEDHEFLDQPMRLEPRRHDHAIDGAVGLEQELAFRQVEIERVALFARELQRFISRKERLQHGL